MSLSTQRLVVVGTGRMAGAVALALGRRGVSVELIPGRGDAVPAAATHVLIAVSDDAIGEVCQRLRALRGAVVLHTSGAAGPDATAALRPANQIGVFHPLQTVPDAERGAAALEGAAFVVAGDSEAVAWARELAGLLGGRTLEVEAAKWPLYHAGAVFASNYCVAMIAVGCDLLRAAGVREPLEALAGLILASAANTVSSSPEQALTGPIRRGDALTVERHLEALTGDAPARGLYKAAGLAALDIARRAGLAEGAAARVEAALHS